MTNFTFQGHLQSYESQTDQPRLCLSCGLRPAFFKTRITTHFCIDLFQNVYYDTTFPILNLIFNLSWIYSLIDAHELILASKSYSQSDFIKTKSGIPAQEEVDTVVTEVFVVRAPIWKIANIDQHLL